jgi:hypothetical protein
MSDEERLLCESRCLPGRKEPLCDEALESFSVGGK